MRAVDPIRIWHQSLTDFATVPGYPGLLQEQAKRAARSTTQVDVHGVPAGTYPQGAAPITVLKFRWIERLLGEHVARAAVQAESEGYDAVAVSCFFDPALPEARSLVDIPVVSALESSFLVALAVGQAVGLVVLDRGQAGAVTEIIRRYGFEARTACVVPLDPEMDEHDLLSPAASDDVLENVERASAAAVQRGADVIIPAEGVLNAVASSRDVTELAGVPFVNGFAATLAHAEMLVQLRRAVGLRTSHVGAMARPPRALAEHFELRRT